MSRGGKRDNAGRKSGWVNLETKLIRVPVAIESQLMAIAKKLDQGEVIDLETKSIEIESVTESKIDSVTDSIKAIVSKYRKESDKKSLTKTTRWDAARKLLRELEAVLYPETIIEFVTETKLEKKELVTESKVTDNDFVTNSEEINNDLVTDSKTLQVEQIELTLTKEGLQPLTQAELADRFGAKKYRSQISEKKYDLTEWSKSKDPDGIAWEYREETKKYYPLNM
jgi:DNA primase